MFQRCAETTLDSLKMISWTLHLQNPVGGWVQLITPREKIKDEGTLAGWIYIHIRIFI